ncbi:heavy metal translocating P-type ATPase [Tepidibacter thalassicus]|uniref:Cd2+/Zn2+-exporting ATPase n=1 Tax=Tepidibacter thalassicus DSM 15285 TaxID=1123350 RepID=A0A1M5SPX8_9FIRM|nr:heavy metal translocating P-type ATPase [Tepidibacter thalassicus]SHH40477.1 Cd2+/Zn2+-exporting ATPase [Tepidibacter thalassicus DSM 15285]
MNNVVKRVFILKNLDCAHCASEIEREIRGLSNIKEANLDFVSTKLTVMVESKYNLEEIISNIVNIVKKKEPHVEVLDEKSISKNTSNLKYKSNKKELIKIGLGALLFGLGISFKLSFWVEFTLFFISYVLVGGDVLLKAYKNILRGQVFDENFLMCIATIGAFAIKNFPEAVGVMLFYQIGEFFQDLAVNRSRKSIEDLMKIKPDFANVKIGDEIKRVSPDEVKVKDVIVVKPGEKIPLDGKIISGSSIVDTSNLTGESLPREVGVGDDVLGGFINKNGLLDIEVTREFSEGTVAKILDLVQNASSKKAKTENFITKFARYYTPAVVFLSVFIAVVPPLLIKDTTFLQWFYRALIFLVISCPCALVLSIPLSFFGGIGGASRNGILIKGSNYLEALNNVDTVVFDKTGTLSKGIFKVTKINSVNMSSEDLLEYVAYAESYSNHPIALSILKAYGKDIDKNRIKSYEEISGYGVKVVLNNKEILVGNRKLMDKENIKYDKVEEIGSVVYVAVDKKYSGYILISDEIKEDSKNLAKELKNIGVNKIVMLTGDSKLVANKVKEYLGIDEFYAELLPHEKVEKLEMIKSKRQRRGNIVFVGDGINDAPVLARADIGVAMGGIGSDAAIEAADVVLMTDEPSKLVDAIKIAKRTRGIVFQNIVFALGVKLIVLLLGAGGLATMWEAVFADVGVALIAVLNSMRVMKVNR